MVKRMTTCVAVCLLGIALTFSVASAQWTDYLLPFIETNGQLGTPVIVADGTGGVIVAWSTNVNGSSDIYAQRYDDHGVEQWTPGGVPVSVDAGDQTAPRIVEDGAGGVFITWQSNSSLRGQHVSATGETQWNIANNYFSSESENHEIAYDGYGGLLLTWEVLADLSYYIIKANRVAADGTKLWGYNGITAASWEGNKRNPDLILLPGASEAETMVSIVWEEYPFDGTTGADIFLQRLNMAGEIQWPLAGMPVYVGPGDQLYPDLATTNASATIVAWRDSRGTMDHGYCQKINIYGALKWDPEGIDLGWTSEYDAAGPEVVSDGEGGIFTTSGPWARRYDSTGDWIWGHLIQAIDIPDPYNMRPVMVEDGDCMIVYNQYAEFPPNPASILANRLDRDTGDYWWGSYGPPINEWAYQGLPFDVLYTEGGVFVAFDWVNWITAASVQRMDVQEGYWGYPKPVITAIEDVPQDEGGWLNIHVRAASNDGENVLNDVGTGYNVWRRESSLVAAKEASAEEVLAKIHTQEKTAGLSVSGSAAAALGLPEGNWNSLGFFAAMQEPYYDFLVPTRTDATEGSEPYEVFVVTAHTTSPVVHFTSTPDSAYSVDNLAPGLLQGLTAEAAYDPAGLNISWQPLQTPDLANYVVYRGFENEFILDLVASPIEPGWVDEEWTPTAGYRYQVAGVDRHGNVGQFANLSGGEISGGSSGGLPRRTTLAQNWPNPFNPQTTIAFDLHRQVAVTLRVFDISGRLTRVLLDEEVRGSGSHEAVWNGQDDSGRRVASGTFFYRLEAGDFSETKRMILIK